MRFVNIPILILPLLFSFLSFGQDSTKIEKLTSLQDKYMRQISAKAGMLEDKLDHASQLALNNYIASRNKIIEKINKVDSNAAKSLRAETNRKYQELNNKLSNSQELNQFIPYLDTLKGSLKYIGQLQDKVKNAKELQSKLEGIQGEVKQLESKMQQAEEIRQFIRSQRDYLKDQIKNAEITKELAKLNKQVFYYQQQLQEYKALLKDQRRAEKKAIELLSKAKPFQDFMQKNSMLASLFNISPDPQEAAYQANLAGLQTRSGISQLFQQRFGNQSNVASIIKENIKAAQSDIGDLKNKLAGKGVGNSDQEIPSFKPNTEKSKSFLKRIEYTVNFQSQKAGNFFPATTDIGLGMGYKLNQNGVIGIGVSGKVGLGAGWNNIDPSYQGLSLRSYVDWKLKGSFYISGGYEMNFRTEFKKFEALKEYSAWQRAGLIGISKIVSVKNKYLKKTKVQLLWDFLSYYQIPQVSSLQCRIGYAF